MIALFFMKLLKNFGRGQKLGFECAIGFD